MVLVSGTRLGPYEVLGLVGAGGMGEIYRARDPRLPREVAIKVLPEAFSRDSERLAGGAVEEAAAVAPAGAHRPLWWGETSFLRAGLLPSPPTGAALRRALVQPAAKHGFRFEDDDLIEKMLSEVSQERGALPLLAFAVSRLWERRDRERGLLTREAYAEIGGVGGALAQHAEATLGRVGSERQPTVRELFRNLVTAQGTGAARERRRSCCQCSRIGNRRTECCAS